ncbi:tetratricopeptide repeat protein [Seleniivibrio sp.]|uniref:tetratricopeptide repeat protein n=1 Tax=Seleniivibrio sp. TaxID=2898801 RepID=UPI0025DF7752|nr:tetratricopeptide repeat protein [Seleniivibrio sp.]
MRLEAIEWMAIGDKASAGGRFSDAINAYEKAINIEPDNYQAWNNMGISLGQIMNYEEALEAFEKAKHIKPDSHGVWNNIGFVLNKLNKKEEALKAVNKALEFNDKDPYILDTKAVILMDMGDVDEAQKCIRKAVVTLSPNSSYKNEILEHQKKILKAIAERDKKKAEEEKKDV